MPIDVTRMRRSIPAHTGEPGAGKSEKSEKRVYPRTHGGTAGHRAALVDGKGLSPHTRGNLAGQRGRPAADGSIPAHTGEPFPPL